MRRWAFKYSLVVGYETNEQVMPDNFEAYRLNHSTK
mgnify:CR=1 FL=1